MGYPDKPVRSRTSEHPDPLPRTSANPGLLCKFLRSPGTSHELLAPPRLSQNFGDFLLPSRRLSARAPTKAKSGTKRLLRSTGSDNPHPDCVQRFGSKPHHFSDLASRGTQECHCWFHWLDTSVASRSQAQELETCGGAGVAKRASKGGSGRAGQKKNTSNHSSSRKVANMFWA